jgi:ABC-type Fe3+-siderophore transport system permease subunit
VQAWNKDAKKWIIPVCTIFGLAFLLVIAFIVRSWM